MSKRTRVAIAIASLAIAAALIAGPATRALRDSTASAGAAVTPSAAARGHTPTGHKASRRAPRAPAASSHLHCFASPRKCGFPDPAAHYPAASSVGPNNGKRSIQCSSLRRSGSRTVTRAGSTVQNLDVTGRIEVRAPNVTIRDVCVTDNGSGNINSPPAVEFDATGGTISHSDVSGANATNESVEIALGANTVASYSLTASHDYLHRCGECVHDDGWTLTDSYVVTNGDPCSDGYSNSSCAGDPDHREAIYCDAGRFTAIHDTLLDPQDQTAALFCDTNNGGGGPCANQVTLENSLLAGGSYVIYTCGNASSKGTSAMTITGNDFARCTAKPTYHRDTGGYTCGSAQAASTDGKGYWPRGGYFGVADDTYCPGAGGGTWSGNYWDDSGAKVNC